MRIKRIELRGFKSFADPTVFQFGPGIAAVVGPNGCGKSNVIDAIRWTLGEQSPSTLRGRAMSDVIFAGSETRPPANRAQVALVFDNTDGTFGGRFRRYVEIEVARGLHRSGDSSYAINRERSRLKDVTALFVDTGVGARAYSIIEQGRVGFVVNARPEERRVLIDEVAGINRFKAQKQETEQRLAQTKANLLRVADLCGEMGRQRKTLQSQVRRAERFLELRRSWKQIALRALAAEALAVHRERARLEADLERREAELKTLDAEESAGQAEVAAAERAAREAATGHERHRQQLGAARGRAESVARESSAREDERRSVMQDLELARVAAQESEAQLEALGASLTSTRASAEEAKARFQDRIGAQTQAEHADKAARAAAKDARAALEAAKARQLDLMMTASRHRSALKELGRRIADADADIRAEMRRRDEAAASQARARAAVEAARTALEEATGLRVQRRSDRDRAEVALKEALAAASEAQVLERQATKKAQALAARVDSERALVASLAGFQPGLRALVDRVAETEGFVGVVADLLDVPAELETEVEQVLGSLLAAAVFRTDEAARDALEWLVQQELGSVSVLVVTDPAEATELGARVDDSRCPGLSARLLSGVVLHERVADIPLERATAGVVGRAAARDGIATVGVPSALSAGQLSRRRELRALEERLAEALQAAEACATRSKAAAEIAGEARRLRDLASGAAHEAELGELAARRDAEEADRTLAALESESARSGQRLERLQATSAAAAAEQETVQRALDEVIRDETSAESEIATQRSAVRLADQGATESSRAVTAARVALAETRQAAALAEREARRLEADAARLTRRRDADRTRIATAVQRADRLRERITALGAEADEVAERVRALEAEGPARAATAAATAEAVALARSRSQALSRSRRELDAGLGELRVAFAQSGTALEGLEARAAREFDLSLAPLLSEIASNESVIVSLPGGPDIGMLDVLLEASELQADPARLAADAQKLERSASALGPVNLAARGEFDDVDTRWQNLVTQQSDLEAAVADLHRALATIAAETRARFIEAFEAVARHFAVLYPRLVGGGRGELRLTDPDKPLTSGVDVRVEPPGKRLQTLRLLSGGEKAMAAIALVFAIFEVKPSPFCLLDEVDAPLDEANSRRFNAMLRELATDTQFVVITHNRTTMEVADVLYGVTMQEPGASSVVSVALDQVPV